MIFSYIYYDLNFIVNFSNSIRLVNKVIENKYIFAQIISIRNIAISKEEAKYKEYDNLDEIEDEDNDIDDNKYLQGNEEKTLKTEKIYYKFGFSSTGDDLFYGFEYNQFSQEIHERLANIKGPNYIKVLLGPNIEVRRGIFYLNNDNFILELRYLESPKYDWENIPEERRNEFANFIKDDRRYISKSVHKMIELGIIKKEYLDTFNEIISEMYFQGPIEPEKIEPDPSKAEDATYQEEIKKKQEEAEKKAQDENVFNEKIKKKIKINIIKPEIFKKKRNNIGAFIIVEPNPFEKGVVEEIEEVPISQIEEEKKEGENEAPKEEEKKEEEKKEEEKKEEEKKEEKKEENPEEKKEEVEKVENVNQEVKEANKEEVKEQSK